ncbi:hypothetical protein TcBrA4_0120800 [Trypanosoma cruzi]|nr:hypothetical protein TcBrA4_0120800 [Trypanosoma cruzi]
MVRRLREALASCSYRVAISWAREQCQSYWIGEGGGGRVVAASRGRGSARLILPPSATRPRSSQASGNMLADVHPLCAPRPIEEEEELDKDDRERNSRVNPLGASSDAPTDMAVPSVAVPLQKQKGVADKGRAAGKSGQGAGRRTATVPVAVP